MIPRIRTWSRRKIALYFAATFLGIGVLVALIAVLGLLYWMDAKVQLPDPAAVSPSGATAALVARGNIADFPAPILDAFLAGLPTQTDLLIRQAVKGDPCPAQLCAFPTDGGAKTAVLLSLGRYPGRFHLVRRDLERRTATSKLPFSLSYHRGKTIFADPKPVAGMSVLTLVGCNMLRSDDAVLAQGVIDGLLAEKEREKPKASGERSPARGFAVRVQSGSLAGVPVRCVLPASAVERWRAFASDFDSRFAGKVKELSISGNADGAVSPVRLSAQLSVPDPDARGEMAKWIATHAASVGLEGCNVQSKGDTISVEAVLKY